MNTVLLGNIVALIGAAIMVSTGFLKTKKQILTVQCFQFVVLSASNAILGAFTGITANVIGIARNLFCMKKEFTTPWKIVFIAAQLALLFAFNSDGVAPIHHLRTVVLLVSSDQVYKEGDVLDGLTPALRAIFGFVGVDDVRIAWADGQDSSRHFDSAERCEMACEAAREIAEEIAEMA